MAILFAFVLMLVIFGSAGGQTGPPGGTTGSAPPANTYVPAYSGGKCYFRFSPGSTTYSSDYSAVSGGWGGSFSGANYISCEGDITVTFTWTGPDAPPGSAILREVGVAGTSGPGSSSSANGLGTQNGVPKYTVKANPGASFSVTCSPHATITGPAPGYTGLTAGVSYAATATPVIVTVGGTKNVGDPSEESSYATLVGRGATGTISAAGFTLTNWSWTIPGDLFAAFVVASDSSTGAMLTFDASNLSSEDPHWYWKTATPNATVTCTVTASIGGTTIGSVTAERVVEVQSPESVLDATLLSRKYYYNPAGQSPVGWSVARSTNNLVAIVFVAGIQMPEDFSEEVGNGRFVQLFSGSDQENNGVVTPYLSFLDKEYPYGGVSTDFSTSALEDPKGSVNDTPEVSGLTSLTQFSFQNSFEMHLMFKPSGDDCEWVPLRMLPWTSNASASRASYTAPWPFTRTNQVPASTNAKDVSSVSTQHPSWDYKK